MFIAKPHIWNLLRAAGDSPDIAQKHSPSERHVNSVSSFSLGLTRCSRAITPGVLLLALGIFVVQYVSIHFTCDDAYISFRYARNIARGVGPVFNVGEHVEGYSNPLWVYILAIGDIAGISPENLAQIMGLCFGAATLVVAFRLSWVLTSGSRWALLVPLYLALSRDLAAWSSSGLEMGLFSFLVLSTIVTLLREMPSSRSRPISAWVATLAALTRPEGLLLAVAVGWVGVAKIGDKGARIAIPAILLLPAELFRVFFYGEVVPNTLLAKGGIEIGRGLFFVGEFLRSHPGFPIWSALVLIIGSRQGRIVGASIILYLAYVITVGGDFMEFRLMLPAMVLSVSAAPFVLERLRTPIAVALCLASAAGCWATSFVGFRQNPSPYMVESIEELNANAQGWAEVGRFMNSAMKEDELIAVGPAGAIPYYSELPTVDMLGLCDAWIAKHGKRAGRAAGHEKTAGDEYLSRRRVVWVVAQPDIRDRPYLGQNRISIRVRDKRYLVLSTTLNPDSLRSVLRDRGQEVVWPDSESPSDMATRNASLLIQGWKLLADGESSKALQLARRILVDARAMGKPGRWVLREAGLLEKECLWRVGSVPSEAKPWENLEVEAPGVWRDSLEKVKAAISYTRLDRAEGPQ